jgi:hypothetical protein
MYDASQNQKSNYKIVCVVNTFGFDINFLFFLDRKEGTKKVAGFFGLNGLRRTQYVARFFV